MKNFAESVNASRKRVKKVALSIVLIVLLCCLVCLFFACEDFESGIHYAEISDDFKTVYYVGDAFEPVGKLKIFYDVDYFNVVPITEDMVSGFNTSAVGDYVLTVTYGDFSATVPIRVLALSVTSITLNNAPSVLYKGDRFPTNVMLTATMSNGTTLSDVPVTTSMLGGLDTSKVGAQTVTVGYLGASVLFSLTIKEDVRVSIALVGARDRYAVGDALDTAGARVNVCYESGKVSPATLTAEMVKDFSTSLGGSFTAKISYKSLECDYPYFVEKAPSSFALIESTLVTIFEKDDPFPEGEEGILTYDDGTTERITVTAEHVPGYDVGTAGEKRVKVVVSGVSDDWSYTVLPEITSAVPYGFTAAVLQGTPFDGLGELIIVYETGDRETIPFTNERLCVQYATDQSGDIEQKVKFRRREISFTVRVYTEAERNAVDRIDLAGVFRPVKLGDPIDVSGVQIGIVYKYLSSMQPVDCDSSWVSADMPESVDGDYTVIPVVVSCFGVEAESTVKVLSAEYASRVTSLSAMGVKNLYLVGEPLSLENATLSAIIGGGYDYRSGVTIEEGFISGFDTVAAGEKVMTVTYLGFSIEVPYRVISEEDKTKITALSLDNFAPLLFVGDTTDKIDRTKYNLTLTLGYGFGSTDLPLSDEAVVLTGGPFSEAGYATITVTYGEFSTERSVRVYPAEDKSRVTSILVEDTIYAYVGTPPDFATYSLKVIYGYGYAAEDISLVSEGVTIGQYSMSEATLVRVVISYEGCECGAFISFSSGGGENVLERVELVSDTPHAFTVGDPFPELYLIAYYRDGRRERVSVTQSMAADFSAETAGSFTITIAYGDKGAVYTYSVTAPTGNDPQEDEGR